MAKPGDMTANVICECGNQFEVVLTGHDPHLMQFTCPACGRVDQFSGEQADAVVRAYEEAVKSINDMIRDIAKR